MPGLIQMLSDYELKEYIDKTGMQNLWQVERDYLQHIILRAIYSKVSKGTVFKGGTALQKLGIVDRFSIDLDFTSSLDDEEFSGLIGYVSGYLNDLGLKNNYSFDGNVGDNAGGINANLKIEGPHFIETKSESAKAVIKLQISRREEVLLGQKAERISPVYKDIPPYVASVMHMEEVAAEKVRAIMTREKPRDVYDLSLLIRKGYPLHEFIVRKKLEGYAKFSMGGFESAVENKKASWEAELKNLLYKQGILAAFPKSEDAKVAILDFFKNNISLTAEFDTAGPGVESGKGRRLIANRLAALNDDVKIESGHIYLPFNAKINAFFYNRSEHVSLELYKNGNSIIGPIASDSITFPKSIDSIGYSIGAEEGSDLYFQIFVEKNAATVQKEVYASIILKKH